MRQVINPESLLNCKMNLDNACLSIEDLLNNVSSLNTLSIPGVNQLVSSAVSNISNALQNTAQLTYQIGSDIYKFSEDEVPTSMKTGENSEYYWGIIYAYALQSDNEEEIKSVLKLIGKYYEIVLKQKEVLDERYENGTVLISGEMLKLYNQLVIDVKKRNKPFLMTYKDLNNLMTRLDDSVYVGTDGYSIEFVYDDDGNIIYEEDGNPRIILKQSEMDENGNYTDSSTWQVIEEYDRDFFNTLNGYNELERAKEYYANLRFYELGEELLRPLNDEINNNQAKKDTAKGMAYNINNALKVLNYKIMKKNDATYINNYQGKLTDEQEKEFIDKIWDEINSDYSTNERGILSERAASLHHLFDIMDATDDSEKEFLIYLYNEKGIDEVLNYAEKNEANFNNQIGYKQAEPLLETLTTDQPLDFVWDSIATLTNGTIDGVINFKEGLENLINHDGVLSANDYKMMYIIQYLSEIDMNDVEKQHKNGIINDEQYEFYEKFNEQNSTEKWVHKTQYQGSVSYGRNLIPILINGATGGIGVNLGALLSMASMTGNNLNDASYNNYQNALSTTFTGDEAASYVTGRDWYSSILSSFIQVGTDVFGPGTNVLASDFLEQSFLEKLKKFPKDLLGNLWEEVVEENVLEIVGNLAIDGFSVLTGKKELGEITLDTSWLSSENVKDTVASTFWNSILSLGASSIGSVVNTNLKLDNIDYVLNLNRISDAKEVGNHTMTEQEYNTNSKLYDTFNNLLCLDVLQNKGVSASEIVNEIREAFNSGISTEKLSEVVQNGINKLKDSLSTKSEDVEVVSLLENELTTEQLENAEQAYSKKEAFYSKDDLKRIIESLPKAESQPGEIYSKFLQALKEESVGGRFSYFPQELTDAINEMSEEQRTQFLASQEAWEEMTNQVIHGNQASEEIKEVKPLENELTDEQLEKITINMTPEELTEVVSSPKKNQEIKEVKPLEKDELTDDQLEKITLNMTPKELSEVVSSSKNNQEIKEVKPSEEDELKRIVESLPKTESYPGEMYSKFLQAIVKETKGKFVNYFELRKVAQELMTEEQRIQFLASYQDYGDFEEIVFNGKQKMKNGDFSFIEMAAIELLLQEGIEGKTLLEYAMEEAKKQNIKIKYYKNNAIIGNKKLFNIIKSFLPQSVIEHYDWIEKVMTSVFKKTFGNYVTDEQLSELAQRNVFLEPEDFRLEMSNPLAMGFNDGKISVINLGSLVNNIRSYVSHENIHQLSSKAVDYDQDFDAFIDKTGLLIGIYDNKARSLSYKYNGINEATTEFFNQLAMGEDYPTNSTAYEPAVGRLKQILSLGIEGFDVETLMKAYFENDVSLLASAIDKFTKEGFFENKLAPAFDEAIGGRNLDKLDLIVSELTVRKFFPDIIIKEAKDE